jgi:hypothetical protein
LFYEHLFQHHQNPIVRKEKVMETKNKKLDLNIEPVSDEILETVLGGIGDEDGISNSCSTKDCSNTTQLGSAI